MEDVINPSHYRPSHCPSSVAPFEAIDVIEQFGLNYRVGNAIKYLLRAGRKPGSPRGSDIQKAIWYLSRELDTLREARFETGQPQVSR